MYLYDESSPKQKNYILNQEHYLLENKNVHEFIRRCIGVIIGKETYSEKKYRKNFNKFISNYPDDIIIDVIEELMMLSASYEEYDLAIKFREEAKFIKECLLDK